MINDLDLKRFLRNNLELSIEKTCHASYTERVMQLKLCGEIISEVILPTESKASHDPYAGMEV